VKPEIKQPAWAEDRHFSHRCGICQNGNGDWICWHCTLEILGYVEPETDEPRSQP
jgi:hypothetical protein